MDIFVVVEDRTGWEWKGAAASEKEALRLAWAAMTEAQRDNAESLDVVDVYPATAF